MYYRRLICLTLFGLLLSGCALHRDKNPHNDVLVFGTTTKFALDVSAPLQNAAIPEFTLGYKRLEAVWMPLKSDNGVGDENSDYNKIIEDLNACNEALKAKYDVKTRNNICLSSIIPSSKYVSVSTSVDTSTQDHKTMIDTYSVFASLGAKGGLSFGSSSGNLAQFFATGIAAQKLASNQYVVSALNAEEPTADAEKAKAEVAKAQVEIEKSKTRKWLLENGTKPEDLPAIENNIETKTKLVAEESKLAQGCVLAWRGTKPANFTHESALEIIGKYDDPELISLLEFDGGARQAILKACKTEGNNNGTDQ